MNPSKILIVNIHSSANAGDNALLEASLELISKGKPKSTFVLAMNDPKSFSGAEETVGSFITWLKGNITIDTTDKWSLVALILFPIKILQALFSTFIWRTLGVVFAPLLSAKEKNLLAAYFESDVVASAAGNYLFSSGKSGIYFSLNTWSIFFALLCGKKVILLPQTIGPVWRGRDQWLLKKVLPKIKAIYLRDAWSKHHLTEIGIKNINPVVVPDIAFIAPSSSLEAGASLLKDYGVLTNADAPILGVTVINWGKMNQHFFGQSDYETSVINAVTHFIETYQGKVVLFSQVQGPSFDEDDRNTAKRIWLGLGKLREHVTFIDRKVDASTLKTAYGFMDIFLGTRLHSCIFALSSYIPTVAIAYQPKTLGLMTMIGLESWVLDIDDITTDMLTNKLDSLYVERKSLEAHLRRELPIIHEQIYSISESITELL